MRHSDLARRGRGIVAAAFFGLLAITTTACSSGASGDSTADGGEPVDGGELTIGIDIDPACIDPHLVSTNIAFGITRTITDGLTDQDLETGEIVPWLAESWEVNDDSTEFTFHLRDGVTFSDGTPFDAEAVKANIETMAQLGADGPLVSSYVAGLESAEVVDDSTITITFAAPNAQLLQATATPAMGMVSVATTQMSPTERCEAGAVGTGPYVFESYSANDATVVTKREDYDWGSSTWASQGAAHVDTIDFQVIPEASTRVGALQSGQVDVATQIPSQNIDQFDGQGGMHLVTRPNPGLTATLLFNLEHPVMADQAVRQAIALGVNREDILTVLGKTAQPAEGLLTQVTAGWSDLSDEVVYDPEAAEEVLDEAGWEVGSDGIRVKDGQRLTIDYTNFNTPVEVGELIQSNLSELGMEIDLSQVSSAEITQAWADGTFDMTYQYSTRNDIDVFRNLLGTAGANNYNVDDPDLQALLDESARVSDPEGRADMAEEIQQYILEKAYGVPLYSFVTVYAASDTVHDFAFEASSRMQLHDVWIQQ